MTRVLALADSDSYLKWACSTLDRLGDELPDLERDVWLVRSPLLPTAEQEAAAMTGLRWLDRVPVVGPGTLRARIARLRPDVILVGATGPVAQLIIAIVSRLGAGSSSGNGGGPTGRPAIVSGLPGIALPATALALRYRMGIDAFIVHSRAERHAFTSLARRLGQPLCTALSRLPFLPVDGVPDPTNRPINRVVFAAQAMFPRSQAERIQVLDALGRLGVDRPDIRVVIKLRARRGERQTHDEPHPYDQLWRSYHATAGFPADVIDFGYGSMNQWLTPGAALVTVSSTAALEAVGMGLPTMVLTDFGLTEELLNAPFDHSGLLGTLADVSAGRFAAVRPQWLRDNWFHPEPSELPDLVTWLAARARAGTLDETPKIVDGQRSASRQLSRTWLRSALPATVSRMVWAARRTM